MFVHSIAHVVEMHMDQAWAKLANDFADGQIAGDQEVADVERQAEFSTVTPESTDKFEVAGRSLDEHAGLGLEAEAHVRATRVFQRRADAVDESLPELRMSVARHIARIADLAARRRARPQRHDLGAKVDREIDRASEEVTASRTIGRFVLEQRREVLAPRIEQEARAGLDRERETQIFGALAQPSDASTVQVVEIELADIGRERDTFVAERREQLEGVTDPMVRQSVGVVSQPEHAFLLSWRARTGDRTDGVHLGRLDMDWKTLLSTFGLIFVAEMGDKTQLAVLTMTTKTKSPWAVFLGATAALTIVSGIAVLTGGIVARYVPEAVLHKLVATAFIGIGLWMFFGKD